MTKLSKIVIVLMLFSAVLCYPITLLSQTEWIENKGQWDKEVLFVAKTLTGYALLTRDGMKFVHYDKKSLEKITHNHDSHEEFHTSNDRIAQEPLRGRVISVNYIEPSQKMEIIPQQKLLTYNNYLIGDDPSKWVVNCQVYSSILVKNVYDNVDFKYYSDGNNLKYDVMLHPDSDPSQVQLKYGGIEDINIEKKAIFIDADDDISLKQDIPKTYSYNLSTADHTEEKVSFKKTSPSTFAFKIKNYDKTKEYVIDPTYYFSSFVGSLSDNWGFTATYGNDGSLYAGGIIFGNAFPTSDGAFQQNFQSPLSSSRYFRGSTRPAPDIVIFKFSFDGRQRIYSTYVGGRADDLPFSMFEDSEGNLVVLGITNSSDFPNGNQYQYGPNGVEDIIVFKLNADGTEILSSARIGGSDGDAYNNTFRYASTGGVGTPLARYYSDNNRSEVILDKDDYVYIFSNTVSSDFPVTANAFQPVFGGIQDAVFIKLSPDMSNLITSSYLGGNQYDAGFTLDVSLDSKDIYIGGVTNSRNMPFLSDNAIKRNTEVVDGFVYHISNENYTILDGTLLGTASQDFLFGLKVGDDGFPYVGGNTYGNWPVINANYFVQGGKHYFGKLSKDLSKWEFSTTFGSPGATLPNLSLIAFSVDQCGNIYFSGFSDDATLSNGPTLPPCQATFNMPITPDAIQKETDGTDFYIGVIESNATGLLYGTFFGEQGEEYIDHVDGGTSRFDKRGVIYQAFCANCGQKSTFPTTAGVWASTNPAIRGGCNLAAAKIGFDLAGVFAELTTSIHGIPNATKGCSPLEVTFRDAAMLAKRYFYDFGDGTTLHTTQTEVKHTYELPGRYNAVLYAYDSLSCNKIDSSTVTIEVNNNVAQLEFDYTKIGDCYSNTFEFTNTSTAALSDITNSDFTWFIDDKFIQQTDYDEAFIYTFPAEGSYKIGLKIADEAYCNSLFALDANIYNASNIRFGTFPTKGCYGIPVHFTHNSNSGRSYLWEFGDGNTSTLREPYHTYSEQGVYKVKFTLIDENTCQQRDSITFDINITQKPEANFTYDVTFNEANFTNESVEANNFLWETYFLNNVEKHNSTNLKFPIYETGDYKVCLIAGNENICYDTFCEEFFSNQNTIVGIPSAFSPNNDGINDKLEFFIAGIREFAIHIYDRRGALVFSSNDPLATWDGTLNGRPLPPDDYYYKVDVLEAKNVKVKKYKGKITLIR